MSNQNDSNDDTNNGIAPMALYYSNETGFYPISVAVSIARVPNKMTIPSYQKTEGFYIVLTKNEGPLYSNNVVGGRLTWNGEARDNEAKDKGRWEWCLGSGRMIDWNEEDAIGVPSHDLLNVRLYYHNSKKGWYCEVNGSYYEIKNATLKPNEVNKFAIAPYFVDDKNLPPEGKIAFRHVTLKNANKETLGNITWSSLNNESDGRHMSFQKYSESDELQLTWDTLDGS